MTEELNLRRAGAEEAGALSAIAWQAKAALGYAPQLLRAWREQLSVDAATIRRQPTWVACVGEAAAGFFSLRPAAAEAVLEHLWVAPPYQRHGIGRALLQQALRCACESGACAVAVDAEPAAEQFYRRLGFRTVGLVPAPIPADAMRVRPQMRRELDLEPGGVNRP